MSDKGYLLKEGDLRALAIGAALLGTGGGGSPYIGMLRTRELIRIVPSSGVHDPQREFWLLTQATDDGRA